MYVLYIVMHWLYSYFVLNHFSTHSIFFNFSFIVFLVLVSRAYVLHSFYILGQIHGYSLNSCTRSFDSFHGFAADRSQAFVAVRACSLAIYHLHGQNIALSVTKIHSPLYYLTFSRLFMCCSWSFFISRRQHLQYVLSPK
jgi:hypothetical protein